MYTAPPPKHILKPLFLIILFIYCAPTFALGWFGDDINGAPCQGRKQGYGPYDYNDPQLQQRIRGAHLEIVERFHFTPEVERLVKGETSFLPGDIDYTLLAFPNHHRALWSMIKFHLDKDRVKKAKYTPAECYLQRALAYRPNDNIVYMLYGIYLHKAGKPERASDYFEKSLSIDPNNAEIHYNYGLLLTDEKEYKKAIEHARFAYKLGYPLPGLRNRLKREGHDIDARNR